MSEFKITYLNLCVLVMPSIMEFQVRGPAFLASFFSLLPKLSSMAFLCLGEGILEV